jgi:inhibitor of KinA
MQTLRERYPDLVIYSLSEKAITLQFGNSISANLLTQVTTVNLLVQQQPFPGFISTIPAYNTLTIYFDPLQVFKSNLDGLHCFEKVENYILSLSVPAHHTENYNESPIKIPVCYSSEFGPDLIELAALHNLSPEAVINLHSEVTYTVYMIGFVPGFAYLGGLNQSLASPRKAVPRAAVPAGSVGIAGEQTGIYPLQTPGGWQIIGRTPLPMFDANRAQPSLLKAGDLIRFEPITITEFEQCTAV